MLKFEGKFGQGQLIKAYDFMPRPDVEDSYMIGRIIDTENTEHGFKAYKILVHEHIVAGESYSSDRGDFAWIPMEVSFGEFDDRITGF